MIMSEINGLMQTHMEAAQQARVGALPHALLGRLPELLLRCVAVRGADAEQAVCVIKLTHLCPPFQHLLSERRSLSDSKC